MVPANKYDSLIKMDPVNPDMEKYTGKTIYVRDTVAHMLAKANSNAMLAGYKLKITYGYRHPDIQKKYFSEAVINKKKEYPDASEDELLDHAHKEVAYLLVAGHLTGGAVDVTLVRGDKPVDMGMDIMDFTQPDKLKTFSDNLSGEMLSNGMVLLQVMVSAGFMPFYGEYWHFSYGDKEWAFLSGMTSALYPEYTMKNVP